MCQAGTSDRSDHERPFWSVKWFAVDESFGKPMTPQGQTALPAQGQDRNRRGWISPV